MGVLKTLTNEYFGEDIRKEDLIDISGVDIVSFTDNNGKFHKHGYRVQKCNPNVMATTLSKLIYAIIEKRGTECSLNDIDVSNIEQMCFLGKNNIRYGIFQYNDFNGDISGWNVSNVKDMRCMFYYSKFTGKNGIFKLKEDNQVEDMRQMFRNSQFDGNIEDWKIKDDCFIGDMFYNTPLARNNNYPQWFKDRNGMK